MKIKKAMLAILALIIVLAVIVIAYFLISFGGNKYKDYSLEEYRALTEEEKIEFQNSFLTDKAFEKWMMEAPETRIYIPWENGGKKPSEYTLEEFEALDGALQIIFQDSFKNFKEFEKWLEEAEEIEVYLPWENGGKKPSEYTWEEFEALDGAQQIKFQDSFKNFKAFEKWLEENEPDEQD